MKNAIVLLSGGVDSTTVLAIAESGGYGIYALSFDYGQRHKTELESARRVAQRFSVKKHLVISFNLRDIGGSALTTDMEVPKQAAGCGLRAAGKERQQESGLNSPAIPVTYVPARNTIFLSFALAWAETLKAADIFIGATAVDYSGYPDCRPEYMKAFETMANLATKASVEGKTKFRIHAPLIKLSKAEIIRKGTALGVDYSLTWSCYDPVREQGEYIPCLKCDSCRFRAKGFEEAGMKDPLGLAKK